MKVVTAQEIQRLDRRTSEEYGIPTLVLMENAGRGVVATIEKEYGNLSHKRIIVIAGKGNNGGDGLVVARWLYNKGSSVRVYLAADPDTLKGDARTNLTIFKKIGGEIIEKSSWNPGEFRSALAACDLIVDSLFGTGLSDPLSGFFHEIVNMANSAGRPVVSVDIPSGISSDTGEVLGIAIRADLTVTFGLPKRGHLLSPGAEHTGKLVIMDIGFPASLIEEEDIRVFLLEQSEIARLLPPRPKDSHKGSFGHVLVIAGSVGKTGAAALTSFAALRSGAGLVTLGIPKSLNPLMEVKLTEVMTLPLPETEAQSLSLDAEKKILEEAAGKRVVALGPGLSTHPETQELVRRLLTHLQIPVILDADGINALVGKKEIMREKRAPLLLTPHPGEMGRLLGRKTEEIQRDRIGISSSFATGHGAFLVLKGAHTIIASPEGYTFINPTGNPGMATAGTGDVLTGMIAGLSAQGLDLLSAATAGVYLHGLAGDLVACERGERGITAGDLLEKIPHTFQRVRE